MEVDIKSDFFILCHLIFILEFTDLDDTLYPLSIGLAVDVTKNIEGIIT